MAMSASRILWGQILAVLAIVLVAIWVSTQWVAWRLGYQPQLGQPWFEIISGFPVYLPPSFFWWWYAFDTYAPDVFVEGVLISRHPADSLRHRGCRCHRQCGGRAKPGLP